MPERDYVEEGITLAKQAIDLDQNNQYSEAFSKYLEALDRLNLALKYQVKEKKLQAIVRGHIEKYIKRAEVLKAHLADQEGKNPKPAAVGANGSSTGGTQRGKAGAGPAKNGKGERDDLDEDSKKLRGALSGAILEEKPNVRWEDVAGLELAKDSLKEAVLLPLKFKHLFSGKRKPWKGILLYGPPGTGKSYLAKAVATEANESTFFSVSSSDLVSKWMGESERLVKNLFQMARENKPAIIFIDEIDALCGPRGEGESEASRRIKTEMLVQMDGVGKDSSDVLVLGATNIPWQLDAAIRRRFQRRVFIGLPDVAARTTMFKIAVGDTPHLLTNDDFRKLAEKTDGYSGSDIAIIVQDALMEPVRKIQQATHFSPVIVDGKQKLTPCSPGATGAIEKTWMEVSAEELHEPIVDLKDFMKAIRITRPTVSKNDLEANARWTAEFGSDGSEGGPASQSQAGNGSNFGNMMAGGGGVMQGPSTYHGSGGKEGGPASQSQAGKGSKFGGGVTRGPSTYHGSGGNEAGDPDSSLWQ